MDIVTLGAARKGSGGGASKEYVDEKVAALIDDTTAAQNKAYSSAKVEEKVAGEEITATATGTDLTLSTSSGNVNALTVYGKSEVVDGAIKSAGEGWSTVDLGTLTWVLSGSGEEWKFYADLPTKIVNNTNKLFCPKYSFYGNTFTGMPNLSIAGNRVYSYIYIRDDSYTDATAFKNSLNGVLLCYQLADPTQGNTIAVKTDDGTGINGTMATFSTGTPLRGIPDTTVRDVMSWDGSSGEVTKNCEELNLSNLTWTQHPTEQNVFIAYFDTLMGNNGVLCNKYPAEFYTAWASFTADHAMGLLLDTSRTIIRVRDSDLQTLTDFIAHISNAKLIYELATPITEQLTSTENASIAGLRTFEPQTHAQNNAGATMTVEAYAGTQNGKAVQELKQDVQSEISALKITQSDTLTLTTAGWSNNAQTVTFAHDTAKRNVIDVDPTSVEEWANCGILATAETASGITFSCKTTPTNALSFKVTSMEVR